MDGTAHWDSALDQLEAAIARRDALSAGTVPIDPAWGPVPHQLAERVIRILGGLRELEREVSDELTALDSELHRRPSRRRWAAPPAPSQLDCSA